MLVCLKCHTRFENNILTKVYNSMDRNAFLCPVAQCYGTVVDIDDLLVDVLPLFWEKGIGTFFCCSGHLHEKVFSPYVMFGEVADGFALPQEVVNSLWITSFRELCIKMTEELQDLFFVSKLTFESKLLSGRKEKQTISFVLELNRSKLIEVSTQSALRGINSKLQISTQFINLLYQIAENAESHKAKK